MDFRLTEEQEMIKEMARNFAREEVEPLARQIDLQDELPRDLYQKMGEVGLLGMTIPSEYGGPGVDTISYCLALEELAASSAAVANLNLATLLMAEFLLRFGSEEQKRHISPLVTGEKICALAMTEPMAGSDAGNMRTTAVKKGDQYFLNGNKVFSTAGAMADMVIVFAKTEPNLGKKGISAFLVDVNTPGFQKGKKEDLLGIRGLGTCEFVLEDCVVPTSRLIGEENSAFKLAMLSLNTGRIVIGTLALGLARRALEEALAYSETREQFGQPIADFQAVQFMLADMAAGIESVRTVIHKAAWLKDNGEDYSTVASIAKLLGSDLAMKATTDALQIHGGYGYTKEYVIERLFRDAKLTQIYEGTNQIQRMILARKLRKDGTSR
ncbi:MAG: acyl-CoA dehydrogenase family protein [Desulfitobacteriaceae bacterium]